MNLQPLFETQKKLMDRIGYNEPDRFEKTILALLVEVGECANEYRGFKYWSKDQEPRTKGKWKYSTGIKNGKFIDVYENPLLEEYVDGLHFVLQLGIELNFNVISVNQYRMRKISKQFIDLYWEISDFENTKSRSDYIAILGKYIALGEMLGFTWEEIEQAYMDKNAENHRRQETGY